MVRITDSDNNVIAYPRGVSIEIWKDIKAGFFVIVDENLKNIVLINMGTVKLIEIE
jgi:hypothetical protein